MMPNIEKEMIAFRYAILAELVSGKDVLEIGAGAALGNRTLVKQVRSLYSFDLNLTNVANARKHAPGIFGLADAQSLPFADHSFDVVAAFEMIYYVPDQDSMLAEIKRVLRPGGTAVLVMANPERPGFHPSPYSTKYHTAQSVTRALESVGFVTEVSAAFPLNNSVVARTIRLASRLAVMFNLVPKTLNGRGRLKKLLYGELSPYDGLDESDPGGSIASLHRVPQDTPCKGYSVLYAFGRSSD